MMQNVGCSETPHFRTSLTKISWISFFCWMRKIVWRRRSLVQTEHPALRYARYLFYRRECLLHGGSTFSLRLKTIIQSTIQKDSGCYEQAFSLYRAHAGVDHLHHAAFSLSEAWVFSRCMENGAWKMQLILWIQQRYRGCSLAGVLATNLWITS